MLRIDKKDIKDKDALKYIDDLEKKHATELNSALKKSQEKSSFDVSEAFDKTQNYAQKISEIPTMFAGVGKGFGEFLGNLSPTAIEGDVEYLIKQSQVLANNMGVGAARSAEFRTLIADTVPLMYKLGIDQETALKALEDIPNNLKVNTTLAADSVVQIGAAAKFSGKDAGTLAENFKDAGFNLDVIGQNMADVANYARSVGVNVEAVSGKVVDKLKYLNTMNFDGGVKGLAKMVTQSEMLGDIMDKVLNQAEKMFNPESAIEFSSALQRLGVQSSELLDPLSAMDMALNDPAKLQDEMVKISQQFTRLKADGSGFEILPGAKLQLKEVAEAMGMNADELAKMALKSSDLEMKMSKIRFPGFAASEEDKQLIANMAQMKDGRAVVQITDEKGQTKEVDVEDLTAEQLKELKKEQADQNKTAEDIARDQLNVLEEINRNITGTIGGTRLAIASSGPLQRITSASYAGQSAFASSLTEKVTPKNVREETYKLTSGIENTAISAINAGNTEELLKSFDYVKDLPQKIFESGQNIISGAGNAVAQGYSNAKYEIEKIYSPVTGAEPIKSTADNDKVLKMFEDFKANIGSTVNTIKQTISGAIDINFKADESFKGLNTDLQKAISNQVDSKMKETFSDEKFLSKLNVASGEVASGEPRK